MKALLFSGGIDSTCIAWELRPDRLVFIDYGQIPARGELRACQSVADAIRLPLQVVRADLRHLGAGLMADDRAPPAHGQAEFWPYRNQLLITLAAMTLAREPLEHIVVGTVSTDIHHPDGSPAFIGAMNRVLEAQGGPSVLAPAADITSEDLVRRSEVPGDVLGWTFSCHTGEWPCGQCNGCLKHLDTKRATAHL